MQETILGRALALPFIIAVKPNVVPLPFGRTVSVVPLVLNAPLHVVVTC